MNVKKLIGLHLVIFVRKGEILVVSSRKKTFLWVMSRLCCAAAPWCVGSEDHSMLEGSFNGLTWN